MFHNKVMANLGTKKLDKNIKFYYIVNMEDQMSEKRISTEELVHGLENPEVEERLPRIEIDAIIARLRAADRLWEAANGMLGLPAYKKHKTPLNVFEIGNDSQLIFNLCQAIADYEA
jgi:TRAP-type uncharacterized transport system substrate-binding protein